MIVGTEQGAWVVPPQRAIWIPAGVRHHIRMVGQVSTRSIYIEPAALAAPPSRCQVVDVPQLLRSLLAEAVDLPLAADPDARARHIIALILHETASLVELPLCVPFPSHARLAERCSRFLDKPSAQDTIDRWAVELHMSRRTFTRLFRRETGLSFAAWRQQACIVAALPRLVAGEAVTIVALDLDYASPAAFTGLFKRVLGASPTQYVAAGAER